MNSFGINKITRHLSFSAQRNANLLPVYLPRLSQLYLSTQATASTSTDENAPEEIILQCKDNIATLTFNRPKKANSIGKQMLAQLHDNISMLSSEQGNDIRCVVLTSCSDKVFSAGADLKERSKMSKEEAASFVTSLRDCMDCLSSLPMPLIASVEVRQNNLFFEVISLSSFPRVFLINNSFHFMQGAALGGGLEIALTADIIVSGTNALFGAPETSLAIIPGAGGEFWPMKNCCCTPVCCWFLHLSLKSVFCLLVYKVPNVFPGSSAPPGRKN